MLYKKWWQARLRYLWCGRGFSVTDTRAFLGNPRTALKRMGENASRKLGYYLIYITFCACKKIQNLI